MWYIVHCDHNLLALPHCIGTNLNLVAMDMKTVKKLKLFLVKLATKLLLNYAHIMVYIGIASWYYVVYGVSM